MLEIPNLRRLLGKHVVGTDGERIGKVTSVYESTSDAAGGTFATVATGLFGSSSSFVPLDQAELHDGDLVVPYSKEQVRTAPRVEDDEELTSVEEQRLFQHYGLADGAVAAPPADQAVAAPRSDDGTLTLSEERLHVGTERVEIGRARLRKYIVTETVTRVVPVTHEELRIQREPIAEAVDGTTAPLVHGLSEEEHEIVLTAERPAVHKEVVPVERVRLDAVTVTEQQTVTEQVRKEHVEVDSDVPVVGLDGPAATPRDQG